MRTASSRIIEFVESCRIAASFGGATLVVMADGSRRRIDTISVGDQVLAWDEETGSTVVETVTATLPHTDTLLTAEFSDGSHVRVTEDHVFFNATINAWMELQYVEPGDQLLSPDGQTVTLVGLDWDPTFDAAAYDLSVSDEHNYFITANHASEPVLVHNMTQGAFCGVPVTVDAATALRPVQDALRADGLTETVGAALGRLSRAETDQTISLLVSTSADDADLAARVAGNLRWNDDVNKSLLSAERELAGSVNEEVLFRGVLGDGVYSSLWNGDFRPSLGAGVLDRIRSFDDPLAILRGTAEEAPVTWLLDDNRQVLLNPLEGLRNRRRGDIFLGGFETDLKASTGTSDRVNSIISKWFKQGDSQGTAIFVLTGTSDLSEQFTEALVRARIDDFVSSRTADELSRIDRIEVSTAGGGSVRWPD